MISPRQRRALTPAFAAWIAAILSVYAPVAIAFGAEADPLVPASALERIAPRPAGAWSVIEGVPAPWAEDGERGNAPAETAAANPGLRGATVRFDDTRIDGPWPLGCAGARYELVVSPAEGLFQGALPKPADAAARALGVVHLPVMTVAVSCGTGVFDYHLVAHDIALFALDGVVWTMRREPPGPAGSPEAVVQELLAQHMTHDMAFTLETLSTKRRFLTVELAAAIDAYFARPMPFDEPPPINGDPFTDSQEYPSRFVLHAAAADGDKAAVPIVFSDGVRVRRVDFVLRREGGGWRLDDLRYEHGTTFRELLD